MSQNHSLQKSGMAAATVFVAAILALFYSPSQSEDRPSVEHVVEITDFAFMPAIVAARPGDTIKWINRDIAPHTATARDESWDTDGLQTGDAKSITVTRGMAQEYFCRFHPMMVARLKIMVEP